MNISISKLFSLYILYILDLNYILVDKILCTINEERIGINNNSLRNGNNTYPLKLRSGEKYWSLSIILQGKPKDSTANVFGCPEKDFI